MRRIAGLIVFLGLVVAPLVLPGSPAPQGREASTAVRTGAISGTVSLHGFPVVARLEARKIRDVARSPGAFREWQLYPWFGRGPTCGAGGPIGTATSGEDGAFRIGGLPPAVYHVTARTGDGTTGQWELTVASPGEVLREALDLLITGHALRGRLRWSDGRPFRGTVSVGTRGTEMSPGGSFVLTDLPRYASRIEVYEPGVISRVVGEIGSDEEKEIDVVVDDGMVSREGRVVSAASGEPIAGVRIHASGGAGASRGGVTMARSDPDGGFRIPGRPGCTFVARDHDYLTETVRGVEGVGPVEIRLRARPVVTGRVVTADGEPVPGAEIWLLSLPSRAEPHVSAHHQWRAPLLSGENGRFRFTSPETGSVMVAVYGGGFMSRSLPVASAEGYNPLALDLSEGETVELELVVVPSPCISGRVTDHDGKPVAGLRVYPHEHPMFRRRQFKRPEGEDELPTAVTGPDGRYRIPTVLPKSAWTVTAYPPAGYAVESDPLRPEPEAIADLTLPRLPDRWVEVRVLSAADGRPVPMAWVHIEREIDWETDPNPEFLIGGGGATGPDGRTRIGPLPAGPLLAGVSHPEHVYARELPVPGKGALTIRLEKGAVLAGRVLMPDGSSAWRAEVSVHDGRSNRGSARADASGRFAFRNLPAGRYRIDASMFGAGRVRHEAELWAETGREDLVLTLAPAPRRGRYAEEDPPAGPPPAGRVAGRVQDPDGTPVRGARVVIRPGNDPVRKVRYETAYRTVVWTDAEGRFAFGCVEDGAHELRADGPPHLRLREVVKAEAGDEEIVIRLTEAAQPVVTILDAAGKPVPGIAVNLHPPGESDRRSRFEALQILFTDSHGQVRFGGLDPERPLVLVLRAPDERDDLADLSIEEWRPADRTIRLEAVRTVRGAVRDRDGYPIGYAEVWFRPAGEAEAKWETVHVSSDGSFEIEEVPVGGLEFRAGTRDAKPDDAGLVLYELEPGEDRAEIVIDGGRWIGLHVPDWPADAEARVCLTWPWGGHYLDMPASGRVRFHGVPAGKTFSIYAGPLPGGRMVHATGLAAGEDHTVPLATGKTISGRIVAPEEIERLDVYVHGDTVGTIRPEAFASTRGYRIEGLPDGKYSVHVLATGESTNYGGVVEVEAGGTADVELRPRED